MDIATHTKYNYTVTTSAPVHSTLSSLTVDDHPQYISKNYQRSYGYVCGGYSTNYTSTIQKYNDVANTWENKASMGISTHYSASSFSQNGFGYCAGGWGSTASVEKYDDVANLWASKTSLGTATYFSAGFSLNGFGYSTVSAAVEKYDDVANTWTVKTSMSISRNSHAGFSLNGYGYVVAGDVAAGTTTSTEKYDDVLNTWTARTVTLTAGGTEGFSLNSYGYIAGGEGPVTNTSRYDSFSNSWLARGTLSAARTQSTCFSLNGYGYIAGGAGPTAVVQKYDDIANTWTAKTSITSREAPLGFSLGYLTENKYISPDVVNIIRLNSRRAVICGSFNTCASTSGVCACAHGLSTAPVFAWAMPIETASTVGRKRISLSSIGGANINFMAASCALTTSDALVSSSISTNFIWMARP